MGQDIRQLISNGWGGGVEELLIKQEVAKY